MKLHRSDEINEPKSDYLLNMLYAGKSLTLKTSSSSSSRSSCVLVDFRTSYGKQPKWRIKHLFDDVFKKRFLTTLKMVLNCWQE